MAKLTSHEELACITLSSLFLDTEKTSKKLDYIASSLRRLNIPTAILSDLLRYDVFPILYPNLLSVAGVWDVSDNEWLIGQVETRRNATQWWVKSLADWAAWWSFGWIIAQPWEGVKERLEGSKL